jgi:transcriptional regulatory protein RtcR
MSEDLALDRFHLAYLPGEENLSAVVATDMADARPGLEVRLHELAIDDPWNFEQVYGALHDLSRAVKLDRETERLLVHVTTGTHVMQICLFLLTEARYFPGKLLQTSPVRGGDSAEGEIHTVDLDLSRYDAIAKRFAAESREGTSFLKSGIDTRSAAFNSLIDEIERVGVRSREPILLEGPTGAGKSQLAGRIYELKRERAQLEGRFVEVNCATLRGDAAMSALFGHVRGAFTGAEQAREGLLRSADGGLLFLDEIGELGLDEQAMLLRAIEERRFLPVGSDEEVESRFQLIAGTNRDLGKAVAEGVFRDDLLARIDLWSFCLPSLAERREDIEPNLDWALERWSAENGQRVTFNREGREAYLAFAHEPGSTWRRNFRDLNSSIARLATLAPSSRIGPEEVAHECARLRRDWAATAHGQHFDVDLEALLGPEHLADVDRFDRAQLAEVVRVCRASKSLSAAGRELFQASRAKKSSSNDADRLRKYLARFGLSFDGVRSESANPPPGAEELVDRSDRRNRPESPF